jgi:predicted dienelactone hydrolase
MPRSWALLVTTALLLSLLFTAFTDPRGVVAQQASPVLAEAEIALPTPTGPYGVGRTSFDWVDPSRDEPFTDDPADRRELVIWVWYPAERMSDADRATYLPGTWGALMGQALRFDLDQISVHAVEGTPVARGEARYPVVILSPGSGFMPAVYTALAEELASHGFIVVGVNHTYNASVTVFADGRVVPAAPEAQPQPTDMNAMRAAGEVVTQLHAADLGFVLDQLEALDDATGPFAGRLDLSRIGVLGHSLGGAAAAELCRVDRRCAVGVNMDGLVWGEAAETGVPVAFLLLMAENQPCEEVAQLEDVTVELCAALETLFMESWQTVQETAAPGSWVIIDGSRHGSYSDAPFLPAGAEILRSLVGGATIEPERMWRVTSDLLLAFFDRHLRGNAAPLLDGPSPEYPEVQFVDADK